MKICVMTLGCKVNKYESDALLYNLKLKGYEVTDALERADVYVINTCAVTGEAEKKSRQMIARCKKFNKNAKIFICGCASEHNKAQFEEKNVDLVLGTAGKIKISEYIDKLASGDKKVLRARKKLASLPKEYEDDLTAMQSRTRAYIKIQDGCDNFCSYCIIPYLRGRSRSRGIFSILTEAGALDDSIKEIVLTGINVTDYKVDGVKGLLTLLQELDKLGKRIRLSSMEDTLVDEEFLKGLSSLENFCPHFHLSLQSGSNTVLKRMNRHYTAEEFASSVSLIRKYFPLAGITTDVIVGFAGESEKEFNETYEFCKKVGFSQLHIFPYSVREGTIASKLYKDLNGKIKDERCSKLNTLNKSLKESFIKKNKFEEVLFEEVEDGLYTGYTRNYIRCYVKSKEDLTDKIAYVKIKRPFKDGAIAKLVKKKKSL